MKLQAVKRFPPLLAFSIKLYNDTTISKCLDSCKCCKYPRNHLYNCIQVSFKSSPLLKVLTTIKNSNIMQ